MAQLYRSFVRHCPSNIYMNYSWQFSWRLFSFCFLFCIFHSISFSHLASLNQSVSSDCCCWKIMLNNIISYEICQKKFFICAHQYLGWCMPVNEWTIQHIAFAGMKFLSKAFIGTCFFERFLKQFLKCPQNLIR